MPRTTPGGRVKQGIPSTAHDLEIAVDREQGVTTLRLRGRIGIDSSPVMRDQLLATLRAPLQQLVALDLTEVSYVDTSGIATLIEAIKVARICKVTFCVRGLQARVVHLLKAAGLMNLFEANACGSF